MKNLDLICTAESNGFNINFYFTGDCISYDNLNSLSKSLTSKDMIRIQIIDQIIDEDKAFLDNNTILIPHEAAANFSEEERLALNFPDPFPFNIEIRASGILTDKDFRYSYRFLNGLDQPFVNPIRIGSYLEITPDQTYLLTGGQFSLVDAIDAFNNNKVKNAKSGQVIKNNLMLFSKIKNFAKETGAALDTYLNSEQVVAPSKIGIRLKKVNDSIEVEPVLYNDEKTEEDTLVKPSLEGSQADDFIKVFDRFSKAREVYSVPGGMKVVLDEQQQLALNQVKQKRIVSGKEKDILLKSPQQIFNPELFYFDDFSDRVLEIGEYKPRVFPFLRPAKESWLPPEGGIIIDGTRVFIPPREARDFIARVEQAIEKGKKKITWHGQSVPATIETIQATHDLIEIRPNESTSTKDTLNNLQNNRGYKHVLIIKDNIKCIDYPNDDEPKIRPGIQGFPRSLRPGVILLKHQKDGVQWLQRLWINGAKGALLADDMGLGKTLQALSFLAWVRELIEEGHIENRPVLIVAPVVLLKNWVEEYRKFIEPIFGPLLELHGTELARLKYKDIAVDLGIRKEIEIKEKSEAEELIRSGRGILLDFGVISKAGAVLTTYETLRDYQFSLGLVNWSVIVLDEAQKIKNPTAMITTAVKAMKYEFALALTGTPVENSWIDLWSIMDFVQPALLDCLNDFNAKYQKPLDKPETDRQALGLQLKERINLWMIRRMKEDYLRGLPDKKMKLYEETMPEAQLNCYIEVIRNAREKMPDRYSGQRRQYIFNTIAALRDISLHPNLPYFSDDGYADWPDEEIINSSARLKKTMEILDEISTRGEKAIIFLISRKMQRVIQRLIKNRFGINCIRPVNGEVTGGRRKLLVDSFQSTKGFNVIIMSPEAAGVGLNVTAANHVIHLSRAWNPAKEDQATDRVYRIGQSLPVTIHIPLAVHPMFNNTECNGTFDLKLHRLLESKRQLSRNVLLPPVLEEKDWQAFGEDVIHTTPSGTSSSKYLTIDDLDNITPHNFEKAISVIYEKMGYNVSLTPQTKDYGADIVALDQGSIMTSMLIQCKHTSNPGRSIGPAGVQEILSAAGVYNRDYNTDFSKLVITNAVKFTEQAYQIASANGVKLLTREDIIGLLSKERLIISDILYS